SDKWPGLWPRVGVPGPPPAPGCPVLGDGNAPLVTWPSAAERARHATDRPSPPEAGAATSITCGSEGAIRPTSARTTRPSDVTRSAPLKRASIGSLKTRRSSPPPPSGGTTATSPECAATGVEAPGIAIGNVTSPAAATDAMAARRAHAAAARHRLDRITCAPESASPVAATGLVTDSAEADGCSGCWGVPAHHLRVGRIERRPERPHADDEMKHGVERGLQD